MDTSTVSYAENDLFKKSAPKDTYVIDHHESSNDTMCIEDELGLPESNVIRKPSSSSTCEILVDEFDTEKTTPSIANKLALGLMSDTAKLKFIKSSTLDSLAKLMELGADFEKISATGNRKIRLSEEVGLAKVFLRAQKFEIGDSFGLSLSLDNKSVKNLLTHYGVRNPQKRIFKMADIEGCSLTCMCAENIVGSYNFEFRNSSTYGDLNVFDLASHYLGGGHYGASGCLINGKTGSIEDVTTEVIHTAQEMYSDSGNIRNLPIESEANDKLAAVFKSTGKLSHHVTPDVLRKVNSLVKDGAQYEYYTKSFRTYEEFMLQNEILSKVPDLKLKDKFPSVHINLSSQDISFLTKKYGVSEEQILGSISAFSNINIKNASIYLPSGKGSTIDKNGNIKQVSSESFERKSSR